MKISFDLDDTLFVPPDKFRTIYGFKVFLVGGEDLEWTEKIKERINRTSS